MRPRRAASATAAARASTELVSDVRDVAVDGVPTEKELLGDLALAQPARDERQHLTLTTRQQHRRRLGLDPRVCGVRRQERAQRARHRLRITGPREMSAPLERDQRRSRDRCRQRAALLVWNRAIGATMRNQRRCAHLLQLSANIEAVDQLEQRGCSLGARRRSLQAREPLPLLRARITEEDVGEHA